MKKTITEIKRELRADGMYLFPDATRVVGNLGTTILPPVNNGKEYLAGYYQAKKGNVVQEKKAVSKRNAAAKFLRAQGFQVWTEPMSSMGGSSTSECYLSAARRK